MPSRCVNLLPTGLVQLLKTKDDIAEAFEVYNGILDVIGESYLRERGRNVV